VTKSERVIELGAGKSGLVGFIISLASKLNTKSTLKEVRITDGNTKCVETLTETLTLNSKYIDSEITRTDELIWSLEP